VIAISSAPSARQRSTWPTTDPSRTSEETMPTRPIKDLDRELRKDPDYEVALQELSPYEEIARQLIAFRIEQGLSQAELARRCGVSQPAIARLERGEHEPRLATLRRVAHALDAELVLDLAFEKGRRREHLATL
jgi:DNA-binding XRE family transcriptional regulator